MGEVVVAISGASGAIYGKRLLEILDEKNITSRLVVTSAGELTLKHECGITKEELAKQTNSILEDEGNVGGKSASGSSKIDAVVICPCSGTTIGKIAAGISDNLVTRSAIVAMKERRKLIIVPRETPYSLIHLENMTKLTRAGAVILPASPGFYNLPKKIDDLVDMISSRVLEKLEIEPENLKEWKGE